MVTKPQGLYVDSKTLLPEPVSFSESWLKVFTASLLDQHTSLPEGYDSFVFWSNLLFCKELFSEEISEPFYKQIDFWLQSFAEEPQFLSDQENSPTEGFAIQYHIPVASVKEELRTLINIALEDENFTHIFTNALLQQQEGLFPIENQNQEKIPSDEDRSAPGLLLQLIEQHYMEIIDTIPFTGDLLFERAYKTFGELEKSRLTLPLTTDFFGFSSITIEEIEEGHRSLFLEGSQTNMYFSWLKTKEKDKNLLFSGEVEYHRINTETCVVSFAYSLSIHSEESIDSDDRNNEKYQYELILSPLEGSVIQIETISSSLPSAIVYVPKETLHVSGEINIKSGFSNTMAVYINANAIFTGLNQWGEITFTGRTQSPWDIGTANDKDFLTPLEEIPAIKNKIFTNGEKLLLPLLQVNEEKVSEKPLPSTTPDPPSPVATPTTNTNIDQEDDSTNDEGSGGTIVFE